MASHTDSILTTICTKSNDFACFANDPTALLPNQDAWKNLVDPFNWAIGFG
jgi:hypothetical protein